MVRRARSQFGGTPLRPFGILQHGTHPGVPTGGERGVGRSLRGRFEAQRLRTLPGLVGEAQDHHAVLAPRQLEQGAGARRCGARLRRPVPVGTGEVEVPSRPRHRHVGNAPLLVLVTGAQHVLALLEGHGGVERRQRLPIEAPVVGQDLWPGEGVLESLRLAGEVVLVQGRQKHHRPLQALGTVHREQRHCVLAAEPGGIQLLGELLLHQDQVVEKSVQ